MNPSRTFKVVIVLLAAAVMVLAQQPVSISNTPAVTISGTPAVTVTSGTINLGTVGGIALDATLTGGTAKFEMYDGANVIGTTTHPVVTNMYDGSFILGTSTHPVQVSLANTAANGTAVAVSFAAGNTIGLVPLTTGGLTIYHAVTAASTNVANIKASAGQIYMIDCYNNATYPLYVKFYNTSGTPTAGTSVVKSMGVQAGTGRTLASTAGVAFSTGIGISITKGITDADATATLLSDATCDVDYK